MFRFLFALLLAAGPASQALADFVWIPRRMEFQGFEIVGQPTSGHTVSGWVTQSGDPVEGEGYTLGAFDMHFQGDEIGLACQLSLFFGYDKNLVTRAFGSIDHCTLNQQPIELACAVTLTYRDTSLNGPAYCNSYQAGDTYNQVMIRVRQ